MVHQPHQGGNYQVNSDFMCIWFFWWSSYHHGNTLVLPWYFHHGKNHRNTRSTFLIFFSENYFIWPIKNIIEGYFYYGFTMVLPWCYHGITMGKQTFIIVAQWWVLSCFVSTRGNLFFQFLLFPPPKKKEYYHGITMMLPWDYRVLRWCYHGITGYYHGMTVVMRWC